MKKEKVISYLNIKNCGETDKSLPQICIGFNIGFTAFIAIFSILLFHPSNFNFCILFAILDVICFIFLMKYHNPLWQFPLTVIELFVLIFKSFYGYIISSKFESIKAEFPSFTLIHAVVLVIALAVIAYVWTKFYQAYIILKNNTISVAKTKIALKNPMPKWVTLIVLMFSSPMVLVRLLRDDFQNLKLGLGFSMWTLGIIFSILLAMMLPKCIVLIRFRVWNFSEFSKKNI